MHVRAKPESSMTLRVCNLYKPSVDKDGKHQTQIYYFLVSKLVQSRFSLHKIMCYPGANRFEEDVYEAEGKKQDYSNGRRNAQKIGIGIWPKICSFRGDQNLPKQKATATNMF